jgi:hypothetical protein
VIGSPRASTIERFRQAGPNAIPGEEVEEPGVVNAVEGGIREVEVFRKLSQATAWSASFLEDMTRTSWATNLQDCDARQFWLSGKRFGVNWDSA